MRLRRRCRGPAAIGLDSVGLHGAPARIRPGRRARPMPEPCMLTRLSLPALVAALLAAGPAAAQMARTEAREPVKDMARDDRQGRAPQQGRRAAVLRPRGEAGRALGGERLRLPRGQALQRAHQRHGGVHAPLLRRAGGRPRPPGRPGAAVLGSGVLVDADGLVITNNHVIDNMNEVRIALADRREFEADDRAARHPHRPRGAQDQGARRRASCRCRSAMPTPSRSAIS